MTTEQKIGNSELRKVASLLERMVKERFITVELNASFDENLNEVTSAQFAISSPPKRGVNSKSLNIRFCPITSTPLELFDVTEANGNVTITPRK